ncbi:DUF1127 domain-containing protein [Pseudomonas sp. NA-150]|uniref:DUF1127 domain-containing protein n=1 Tax=Pseudomonas sp. NA-150 TaxID=3367525 RepID=UPI0037CB2B98
MKTQTGFNVEHTGSSTHWLSAIGERIATWYAVHQARQALAKMSDDTLKDIGMSRADIQQEAELPFWKSSVTH